MRFVWLLVGLVAGVGGFSFSPASRFTFSQQSAARPIVYRMTAKWCKPCRKLEEVLTPDIKARLPFELVDWDVDEKGWKELDKVERFSIPAFWWKSPEGELYCKWKDLDDLIGRWKLSKKKQP